MRTGSAIRKASGARPRARSTGTSRPRRFSIPTPASTAAGSSARAATPATTRSTAMSRAAAADQPALIYDSPGHRHQSDASPMPRCCDEVATLAAVLQDLGVGKGDRVIIYMPMIPEAVFAMLACARIGAVHSVVFGGFAATELATPHRRCDAEGDPVGLSCGIEPGRVVAYKPLLDEAIDLARHKPQACLIFQRPQAGGGSRRRPRSRLGHARDATMRGGPSRRLRAGRRHRSALHPLHLGHDRPARKASCATMAAIWSR